MIFKALQIHGEVQTEITEDNDQKTTAIGAVMNSVIGCAVNEDFKMIKGKKKF